VSAAGHLHGADCPVVTGRQPGVFKTAIDPTGGHPKFAGHLAMTAEGYNGASLGERSNKQTNFAGQWRRQA
jgi:hypothetical protein